MAKLPKYPNQPSEEELTDFLTKVDEIDNVIKGMNSEDVNKRNFYMKKADNLIKNVSETSSKKKCEDEEDSLPTTTTGFSKTSINKDAFKREPPGTPVLQEPVDQQSFMVAMEADAKARSEKRQERMKIAAQYKEQGNVMFNQGDFQRALELYDKAIQQTRDNTVLYTNRAQTKIKLGLYSEALSDCNWALKIWPDCLKAYVYKGHAYMGLQDYDNARNSYRHILTIDKKKENIVKEYVAEIDRREQANKEESKAAQLFEEGNQVAKNVVDLLTSINKKGQHPLYYAGGFRVISSCLDGVESQSLFRTNNGLQLPVTHDSLKQCITASPESITKDEIEMLSAALDMFAASCKDNETSQQQLIGLPELCNQLLSMIEGKGVSSILKTSCLNLLHEVSLTTAGRAAIVSKFDIGRVVTSLFHQMVKKSLYADMAAAFFNNIALDKRLKAALRDKIEEEILPAFEYMLKSNKTSPSIAVLACSAMMNLTNDVTVRNKMASRVSIWTSVANLLISYTNHKFCNSLEHLLGLLVNLSTGVDTTSLKNISPDVTVSCYDILTSDKLTDTAMKRSISILSNITSHCDNAAEYLCETNRFLNIVEFMKNSDPLYYKPALKCMAKLTENTEAARTFVENKGTSGLLNFLLSEDEVVIGNTALCLSHLCQIEKFSAKLTKTNVIQKLLVLARDERLPAVQANCAILIGKLVQTDSRHLERLRELHGIEILHSCMKHVK